MLKFCGQKKLLAAGWLWVLLKMKRFLSGVKEFLFCIFGSDTRSVQACELIVASSDPAFIVLKFTLVTLVLYLSLCEHILRIKHPVHLICMFIKSLSFCCNSKEKKRLQLLL